MIKNNPVLLSHIVASVMAAGVSAGLVTQHDVSAASGSLLGTGMVLVQIVLGVFARSKVSPVNTDAQAVLDDWRTYEEGLTNP